MDLETFWFCVVVVVWAMYFLLEGFDFGVGMLLPFVPRSDEERSTALRTIGPVWDGNEVWLVVAGGATFAAFPAWYATMFSGFYLALLLILVFLIVRVVSFEWRSKSETPGWRSTWTWANTIGSFGASLLWGIGLSSLLYGTPIDSDGDFTGERPGPVQPVQRVRRNRGGGALRVPRRDLPHAPHGRRVARPRRGGRPKARDPGGRAGRGVPRLDRRGRDGPQRQGSPPAGAPRGARDRGARARDRLPLYGGATGVHSR